MLATQTLVQEKARNMKVEVTGRLPFGTSAKDLALALIGRLGAAGANGHVLEFCGDAVTSLGMEARMTLCNMAIEAGARVGLIAPDEKTFAYVRGRERAPAGDALDRAIGFSRDLPSDPGAVWDRSVTFDASRTALMVTWGTNPEAVLQITDAVPDLQSDADPRRRAEAKRMLDYMGLSAGQSLIGLKIDVVFIGSCTNGRLEDLRSAGAVVRGRKVASHVRALVVPGSGIVKRQAESEGLDKVFTEAGFEWRDPGCSMCLAMNGDVLMPGQRAASTSNRNFEGRQGPESRTHLVSPAMAAAAAISGALVDVRELLRPSA